MQLNIEELKKMQSKMQLLNQETKELKKLNKRLKEIFVLYTELEKFYKQKWSAYHESNIRDPEKYLEILGEDALYNAITEAYFEAKKLVKNSAAFL